MLATKNQIYAFPQGNFSRGRHKGYAVRAMSSMFKLHPTATRSTETRKDLKN